MGAGYGVSRGRLWGGQGSKATWHVGEAGRCLVLPVEEVAELEVVDAPVAVHVARVQQLLQQLGLGRHLELDAGLSQVVHAQPPTPRLDTERGKNVQE